MPNTKKKLTGSDLVSVLRNSLIFGIPILVAAVGGESLRQLEGFDLGIFAELIGVVVGTIIKGVDRWARNTPL